MYEVIALIFRQDIEGREAKALGGMCISYYVRRGQRQKGQSFLHLPAMTKLKRGRELRKTELSTVHRKQAEGVISELPCDELALSELCLCL